MFATADVICPQIQLGAENNIEKSRCLAHLRKKIGVACASHAGFSGFRAASCRRLARDALRLL
jgi:hypothetical protein